MQNFIKFLIFFLILLGGISGIAIYWTFYKPLPDYHAVESYEMIDRPVDIHWDSHGIPHIYAQNKKDLYFSVGYVHAQDRLWQMTLTQLAAQGRFAEFFGPDLIPEDKQ
jgi:penicillin amidase